MNQGVDMAGHSIGKPSNFTVGCALNMGADDIDREIRILKKKLEAGADFALGQAIFEPGRIQRFHERFLQLGGQTLRTACADGDHALAQPASGSFFA